MIRNEQEYRVALQRMEADQTFAQQQRAALEAMGLPAEQVERAMQPALAFHEQLSEEVDWYTRIKSGDISTVYPLTEIGRLLIALRIANGLTQRELADRLNVAESQVSRDERREYYGVSPERAQRIAGVLKSRIVARIEPDGTDRETANVR